MKLFSSLFSNRQNPNTIVESEILMDALKANDHRKALKLVRNVNSVNYTNNDRASLLFIAAVKGYLNVCEELKSERVYLVACYAAFFSDFQYLAHCPV